MSHRLQSLFLLLLVTGAAVNLAAGARRPLVERSILARGHYPAADAAADAVRRLVPPSAGLALVTYDGDFLGELDCAVWADYRFKWLLYPRAPRVYRLRGETRLPAEEYAPGAAAAPAPGREEYALYFRVAGPPLLPEGAGPVIAAGEMFALVREGR